MGAGGRLLRISEVLERMAIGRTKLRELTASGEIRAVYLGRAVRIPEEEIERWVRERQAAGPESNAGTPSRTTVIQHFRRR